MKKFLLITSIITLLSTTPTFAKNNCALSNNYKVGCQNNNYKRNEKRKNNICTQNNDCLRNNTCLNIK